MKPLREYQHTALKNVIASFRAGNKRVVLYAPTAAGKSVMAVGLVDFFLRNGKSVAIVANRIGLVHQFSQHLQVAKIEHGIIQGDNTFNIHSKCLVCSIDTLAKRGFPNKVDCLIVDESHFVASHDAMKKIIFSRSDMRVIGLTATPFAKGMAKPYFELDDEPLFQDMVITSTISKLIDEGFLVDCEIYAPTDPDLTGVKSQRNEFGEMDYSTKGLGDAVDKPDLIGDIVDHWFKLAEGKKTVIFATNVNHSKHIVEQFCKRGIKAAHVDGYMDQEEKFPIMQGFEKGDTLIISNVAMLKEGWDLPSCEVMILAKPTKSLTAFIQMVGRVLRIYPGKNHAIVIDHSGSVHKLGLPTDDLPLSLCDGSAKKSVSEKRQEQEEKKERKCPKCSRIKKARKCESCGYEPPVVNTVQIEDGFLEKVSKATKADKQDWYSMFLGWAKANNKTANQAAGKYKSKFGVWPRGLNEIAKPPNSDVIGFIKHANIAFAKSKAKVL